MMQKTERSFVGACLVAFATCGTAAFGEGPLGENNYGRFSDPAYDAIIANCSDGELSTKLAERWSAMKDAEKIIMREAVIFPLYQQCGADLMKSNVRGVAFHPVGINRIYKNARK